MLLQAIILIAPEFYHQSIGQMNLIRYARITETFEKREIVLLKGLPCVWGKCSFCNYIDDNSPDVVENNRINREILEKVTGEFGVLQVINSGSCFEIPAETMEMIRFLIKTKKIFKIYFESHWLYRERLQELRDFFAVPLIFLLGIETFDDDFRNLVLNKNIVYTDIEEVKRYFQSICLMVGIQGQTRDMISRDVEILLNHFSYGTINLFVENGSVIKPDYALQDWFRSRYSWLPAERKIDILWNNTDFGVGGDADE